MSAIPENPSVELLRKRAKDLLRAARRGEAAALARLRPVARMRGVDAAALAGAVRLADAQHAVAREQGAASWPRLLAEIEDRQAPAVHAERLLAAVRQGDRRAVQRILSRWPAAGDVNVWSACAAGRDRRLAEILTAKPAAATAAHDGHGWQPILYACASPLHDLSRELARGLCRAVEMLLAAGADANAFTLWNGDDPRSRLPALFRACFAGNAAVVRVLLEHGAQPNDGESVYHAAELDHRDCLAALLAHGADLSGRQAPYDNTPLNFLAGYKESHAGCAAATRGMQWLLEHGADPNVTSYARATTPLHTLAAGGRSRAAAAMLLAHGAEVDKPRADGRTAYVLAVRIGNFAVADLLLEHGADAARLTARDELVGACWRGDEDAARAALARDPAARAALARDLALRAAQARDPMTLGTFDAEDRAVLPLAAEQGNEAAVRLMVKLGFDLAAERDDGGTPLHTAAWMGLPSMVRLLLELGAPLDRRDSNFGSSPLAWAAHGSANCRRADDDYRAAVELLLDAGAERAPAINRLGEPPESLCTRRVAALLRRRGFAARAAEGKG